MQPVRTQSPLRAFLPRALVFLTVFSLLQLGWQGVRGTAIQDFVVHDATVRPAAFLVRTLTPAVRAEFTRGLVRIRSTDVRAGETANTGSQRSMISYYATGVSVMFLLFSMAGGALSVHR